MGTRSYIALQIEGDEYLTIFCHYNGYPDDNGAILAEHYDKQEKVVSLIHNWATSTSYGRSLSPTQICLTITAPTAQCDDCL